MNQRRRFLMAAVASLLGMWTQDAKAKTYVVDPDTYAAIAYSPATGNCGYAHGYYSRDDAEQAALKHCEGSDRRIVCWVNAGWCALALGDDQKKWGTGWSFGDGSTMSEATDRALKECKDRTTGARLRVLLLSDGQLVVDAPKGTNVIIEGSKEQ